MPTAKLIAEHVAPEIRDLDLDRDPRRLLRQELGISSDRAALNPEDQKESPVKQQSPRSLTDAFANGGIPET